MQRVSRHCKLKKRNQGLLAGMSRLRTLDDAVHHDLVSHGRANGAAGAQALGKIVAEVVVAAGQVSEQRVLEARDYCRVCKWKVSARYNAWGGEGMCVCMSLRDSSEKAIIVLRLRPGSSLPIVASSSHPQRRRPARVYGW